MIQSNVIHGAMKNKVKKLLFMGSSCIYPKDCPQPIKEDYLLTSKLKKLMNLMQLQKLLV